MEEIKRENQDHAKSPKDLYAGVEARFFAALRMTSGGWV
jgi:hypothetical protein